jgi:RNA polymerase sigma factor (sigma-70 family)
VIERGRSGYSEQELVDLFTQAQQGDKEAREQIFFFLRGRFLAVAKHRLLEADAEDVVQETLMVVHDSFSELRTVENLMAYTMGVLRNKIGNAYRKRERRRRHQANVDDVPEPVYVMDDEFNAAELARLISQAVVKANPNCRAILLGLHEGFSVDEMSRWFRIPRSKMDKRIFRCRRTLRRILSEDYGVWV